ncbi:MAG TPA: DNA mismatch repair protein MutS [Candidatus Faecivivens stercoripullorum]|uniref:DNA mismatch repair protein MutS n=1 Tax=Candidatus Faecivivens stercoripullorum TaxID=2840805 RepID=A0A9D1H753_9FIRM|nr:DNA mismatch repair protein MutS [Candidatus Faecivivens stercoripullorum]
MAGYRCVNGIVRVDIHHMYAPDAKKYLERLLKTVGSEVREIEVIHGFHGGTSLQQTVRTEVRSRRILRRGIGLNPGLTVYYLK